VPPGEEVILPVWVRIPEAVVAASARAFRNDPALVVGQDWIDVGPELEPILDDFPGLGRYTSQLHHWSTTGFIFGARPPLHTLVYISNRLFFFFFFFFFTE
jgi:hypothetical protein